MLTYVAESQFCNIHNAGGMFYTQSVKDVNFCMIRCKVSGKLCIRSAAISKCFAGRDFAEGTTSE